MKRNNFIENMLDGMSIKEKINQTICALVTKDTKFDVGPGAYFIGGQIITEADDSGLDNLRTLVADLEKKCDIPPLVTSDFENGCGSMIKGLTPLPYMMGLGATYDAELAYDYGRATALEARSIGANWTFSPVVDLNINRRNPLINNRGMTDDADLGCKMFPQIIKGMQEHDLLAGSKHFPGDGVDYRDQHIVTTENTLSMEEWYATFGEVYKAVIEAGTSSIMAGHITLPAYPQEYDEKSGRTLPATLNKYLITELLKGEFGFEGVVVTDALNMAGFVGFYDDREQSEIESFKAGCDMMLWPTPSYASDLEEAILSGEISMERLDDAVRRILTMKYKAGLFDSDYERFRKLSEEEQTFIKDVQKRCANKSITLVRDKAKHFPLSSEKTKHIGLIIVTEHAPAKKDALALKEELEKRGFVVDCNNGTPFQTDQERDEFYNKNDLIIYAAFSRAFRPIGFLDFSGDCAELICAAFRTRKAVEKVIAVSFGSPYFGDQYFEKALTYVNAYSMLDCAARGFVRVACGEAPFEGKSPVKLWN